MERHYTAKERRTLLLNELKNKGKVMVADLAREFGVTEVSIRKDLEELENRKLLRRVMTESGFITCISEWWHFNHIPSIRAKSELKIIDF